MVLIVLIVAVFMGTAAMYGMHAMIDDVSRMIVRHVRINRASIRIRIGRYDYRVTRRNHRIDAIVRDIRRSTVRASRRHASLNPINWDDMIAD